MRRQICRLELRLVSDLQVYLVSERLSDLNAAVRLITQHDIKMTNTTAAGGCRRHSRSDASANIRAKFTLENMKMCLNARKLEIREHYYRILS